MRAARLERQPQRHARPQHMLLAHHLGQCARAQDFGQGLVQAQGGSDEVSGFSGHKVKCTRAGAAIAPQAMRT